MNTLRKKKKYVNFMINFVINKQKENFHWNEKIEEQNFYLDLNHKWEKLLASR